MKITSRFLVLLACALLSRSAQAALFEFPTLDQTKVDTLSKTLAGDLMFRPLEGPSAPDTFGFGFGATVIVTPPDAGFTSLVGSGVPFLPAADLSLHVQGPMGFGLYVGYLPTFSFSGTSFGRLGVAAQWTFTKLLSSLLIFDAAIKLNYTGAGINYSQLVSGGTVAVSYGNTQWGLLATLGKKWVVFEPYVGVGLTNQSTTLSATGTTAANLLPGFPSQSTGITATSAGISPWLQFGLQIKLGFFTLGGEADYAYGLFSYGGKIGFKF